MAGQNHMFLNKRFDIGTVVCPKAEGYTTVTRTNNSANIDSLI